MVVPTSLMIASFEEIEKQHALDVKERFAFPAMAIPFGADANTNCRFFDSFGEIEEEDVLTLLSDSYPMPDGIRRFHLITANQTGENPKFKLESTFQLLDH